MSAPQRIGDVLAAIQARNFDALRDQAVRIRPGQRKLIFAIADRPALRDEQLHDLVEWASGERTRAISKLTIDDARRLTGLLKGMERAAGAAAPAGPKAQETLL